MKTLRLTLRHRLVLLVVAAMLPLFGLAVLNAQISADAAIGRATDNLKFAVSLAASNQHQITETAHQLLTAIAQSPAVRDGTAAACNQYLVEINRQLPGYANLGIVGADGFVRCHGLANSLPLYVGDRSYFREAVDSKSFVAGDYLVGRLTGKSAVVFALPVLGSDGRVAFVAFASMELDEMARSIAAIALPDSAALGIHDRHGTLLAAKGGIPLLIGEKVSSPVLLKAVNTLGTGVSEGVDSRGRLRLWAFMPSSAQAHTAFVVVVSMDRSLVVGASQRQLKLGLAGLTLVALLGAWMAWLLGGHAIVKPAADILDATRQFEQGRRDVRIALEPGDDASEFSRIAAGFNRMAGSMQAHQAALEAELAASQGIREKLQDTQRLARVGYWQLDLATKRLSLSEELCDLFEFSATQLDGSLGNFLTRIHRADWRAFEAACDAAIRTSATLDIEFRIVLQGGEVRWLHQFGRASSSDSAEAGPSTCRTGVIQDITERKNAELAIARSTELLHRTGTLAMIGGWDLDALTMALYWSEETYRIHDLAFSSPTEFEKAVNFYDAEARPVIRSAMLAALEHATPYDLELPLTTATGRRIWVRTQGRALLEGDKVVRLVGVMQDISAQHKVHEHLRLLETCISHLNDMVVITEAEPIDEPGPRIVFVNDAFERHTGYCREDVLGRSPRFLQGPKTQRLELDRIVMALNDWRPVRSELINYTKTGQEYWTELDIVPVSDARGALTHWVSVERDITQRKLAEQALMDSEQRYAALFETAPLPMWVYDIASMRFLAVNQAAVEAYGYSVAEFLAMTIFDLRPKPEHALLRQWLENPLRKKMQWHDLRKDGSLFSVETVSQPIQHVGQSARLVVAVDKTAQDEAEKEIQNYLFTLQRAADAAQAIIWHQTLDGMMQEIADQARGVIGTHQAVVTLSAGSDQRQALHALSLSEKYDPYRGWVEPIDGSGIYETVCEKNRPVRMSQAELEAHPQWHDLGSLSGKRPPMRGWLAVPLIGKSGKNIGVLQLSDKYEGDFTRQDEFVALELSHLASAALENSRLLEEISQLNAGLEQKVAERTMALARQEALFRALAEQAPQFVWTASPDGRATYFNRAWFDLMGGTLPDWTGLQWLAVIHPEDVAALKANWEFARSTRTAYAGIRRLMASDGSLHTMAYRASPVFDEQGGVAFWVGIDADVTEIKAIEAALRLSNQELEAFSYSVSHDLRSPLNTVDGFSRLLAKQLASHLSGDASTKASHYLMRIQAGVAQMGQLIEDLLSLSQVTRAQLRSEAVDLSFMAHSILDEWQTRQPGRQVTVSIESDLQAQGDARLVRIMMENLLSNAWKFTSQKASAHISVGRQADAGGLPVFFVKDDGAGFDMAFSDKLFDPFQRLHTASEFSGTGIGLATVSRIVKRHGGRIWAESAPGGGATFFFTLPQGNAYLLT